MSTNNFYFQLKACIHSHKNVFALLPNYQTIQYFYVQFIFIDTGYNWNKIFEACIINIVILV